MYSTFLLWAFMTLYWYFCFSWPDALIWAAGQDEKDTRSDRDCSRGPHFCPRSRADHVLYIVVYPEGGRGVCVVFGGTESEKIEAIETTFDTIQVDGPDG